MTFSLKFADEANNNLKELARSADQVKRHKAVLKTLGLMETNLRHPGLQTHKYQSMKGPRGEEVFEAYAEQNTPAAYRVFWYYGPAKGEITIIAITAHP